MLRLLLQLWWTQKKRTFDWKKLGILVYFFLCFMAVIGAFLWGFGTNFSQILHERALQSIVVPLAMSVIPICLMSMFMMKIEENGMDNAIKSRPFTKLTWGKFIIVSNIIDYWTAFPPILITLIACFIMPFGYALLAFVLAYIISTTVALFVTSVRLSNSYLLTTATWVGFVCFLMFITPVVIVGISFFSPIVSAFVVILFVLLYAGSIFVFIYNLNTYDEQKKTTIRGGKDGKVGIFTMEWAALWRTKRFKKPIILFLLIFTGEAYFMGNISGGDEYWTNKMNYYMFFLFIISYAPIVLGQFVLGIEANFIDGLLTKPYALEDHLINKYHFFIRLNCISAMLLVPGVFFKLWGIDLIITSVIYSFALDLLLFFTCLKSSRVDLFSSGFFNYQGANMGFNVFGLLPLFLLAIYVALLILFPSVYLAEAILCVVGIIAFALHKKVIKMIANKFKAKKYERLEKLRQ